MPPFVTFYQVKAAFSDPVRARHRARHRLLITT
jgi:hypothetical protein